MTAVIVDDESKSRDVLTQLLNMYHSDIEIIAYGDCVKTGLALIQEHSPDLVFLDVQMPDGTGFDLLKQLDNPNFTVIFTTAHLTYSIPAIQAGAVDFLLKPIGKDELKEALQRAQIDHQKRLRLQQIQTLLDAYEQILNKQLPTRITIATANELIFKPVSDIIRFQSDRNYTWITLANESRKLMTSVTIGVYEEQYKDYREFMRVHRSHIVNLLYVESFIPSERAFVVLKNGEKVEVARAKRDEVQRRLRNL